MVTRNKRIIAIAKLFPFLFIHSARVGTDVSSYFEIRLRRFIVAKYLLALMLIIMYSIASNDDYETQMSLSHANGAPRK